MAGRSRTRGFARWVTRHHVPVAWLLLVATAFFAWPVLNAVAGALGHPMPGPSVRIGGEARDLFPDHPYIRAHDAFAPVFGGASLVALVVRVEDGTIFRPEVLRAIAGITRELDGEGLAPDAPAYPVNHDTVRSLTHPGTRVLHVLPDGAVEQRVAVPELPETAAEAFALREALRRNPPAGYERLVSSDESAALVSAGFVAERLDGPAVQEALFAHVRRIGARWEERVPGLRVFAAGEPVERGWVLAHTGEILGFLAATLAGILVLLWLSFRRWHGVFVPALAAGATALWGLGFAGWVGIPFDPLVLVIPMLISARAVSHTVQMAERFFEEYSEALLRLGDPHRARDAAAASAMGALLVPGTLGVVTDAAGLLVILVTSIEQMRHLAVFGAFWVAAIVVTVEILHPVLICLLPPPDPRPHAPPRIALAVARACARVATHPRGRYAVVAGSAVLLAGCVAVAVTRSTIGHSGAGSPLFWSDHPYNRAAAEVAERFGGVDALVVYADGDRPHASADAGPVRTMQELERALARETDLGASASIAPLLAQLWRVNHYGDPKWEYVPADSATVRALIFQLRQEGAPGALRPYLSDDGRDARVVLFYPDHRAETIRDAVGAAERFLRARPQGPVTVRLEEDRAAPGASLRDPARWLDLAHYFLGPMLPRRHHTLTVAVRDEAGAPALEPVRRAEVDGLPGWIEEFRAAALAERESRGGEGPERLGDWAAADVGQWWESEPFGVRAVEVGTGNLLVADGRAPPSERAPRHQPTGRWTRGVEWAMAGGSLGVLAAIRDEVERSHVANLSLIFAVIFALHSLTYRSLGSGAIVLLQIATATALALAVMALRGVGLDVHTLPVQSVGVGLGVDYAIYMVDRIRQEGAGEGDPDAAIRRAVETTGVAVCVTATTITMGIGLWIFSGLRYQAEMAGLLAILMGLNMLGALLVVPACHAVFRPGLRRQRSS